MEYPRDLLLKELDNAEEKFKSAILNYVDKLTSNNLPVIFSLKNLALLLNMEYGKLHNIVNSIDWHYAYYTIRKKRGGKRRIVVPHENLKNIQRWILMEILEKSSVNSACKGFVKQRGIVDNAKPHVGKKFIRKFDLKDFFESIDVRRIYGIFHELGYSEAVSHDLATLCTIKISDQRYDNLDENKKMLLRNLHEIQYPVLAQGAPTSPMLANLVCRSLDARFAKYSSLNGVSYTRYADDLTFSADDITKLPSKSFVRRVVEEEGLKLNNSKTGTYGRDRRQMVTGILIDGDHMHLPQKYKRQITRHLHFCEKYGAKKHFNHIMPGKGNYKEWLYGKIYFLYAVEPNTAKALLEIANNIDWGLL